MSLKQSPSHSALGRLYGIPSGGKTGRTRPLLYVLDGFLEYGSFPRFDPSHLAVLDPDWINPMSVPYYCQTSSQSTGEGVDTFVPKHTYINVDRFQVPRDQSREK